MKSIYFCNTISIDAILGSFSGCASVTPVRPGAENILITKGSISRDCKWVGKVSVTNGLRSMSTPYQHSSLKSDEFNRLKNQAAQLGASTVLLSISSGMVKQKQ